MVERPSTGIIVAIVIAALLMIGALVFMIVSIIQKNNCENSEDPTCPKLSCGTNPETGDPILPTR